MNTLKRRVMRLAVMTVGLAGLFVAVNAVPGAATDPSAGFHSVRLGYGTLSHGSLAVKPGMAIVVVRNNIEKGASSGWHSHPGGAIVVVVQGQITTYKSVGKGEEQDQSQSDQQGQSESDQQGQGRFPHCVINTYFAGQSFTERPGEPLNAVNTGLTETISYATFPGVPVVNGVTMQRTQEPNPGTCPV